MKKIFSIILNYRYAFNGMEKDDEVKGSGNSIEFKERIYDPRIGKFLSIDPLFKEFPYYSVYQFASNNPILAKDLEGLESSDNKNESEKKTSEKTKTPEIKKPADGKTLDPKTVGKNFDNSNYIYLNNPKNTDGTDSYEPAPQEIMDARAKKHDQGSGFIQARTNENIKADLVFVAGATSDLAKAAENAFIIPYMGAKPNIDPVTNKPISGTTAKRALVGATAIQAVTAAKILLKVTVDPAVKVYDYVKEFVSDVKYQTEKGISDIQNWGN